METQLTMEQEARIKRAFTAMPYGGNLFNLAGPVNPTMIADNLERLRDRLQGVAERDQATERELSEARAFKAMLGRFLYELLEIAKDEAARNEGS